MNSFKAYRRHLGLTQMELARLAGVTQAAVSQWESMPEPLLTLRARRVLHLLQRHAMQYLSKQEQDIYD